MKKLQILFFALTVFILLGCEENFSPKGDFEEKFALTCLVRGDTALQIASLFSSYDVDGYDPSVYDENPAYLGADIRLWYQDTVYIFEENTVFNPTNPDSLFHFYYLDKFKPTGKGELLEIEATLRNGKRLRASCYTPGRFNYNTQETSNTIPPVNTSNVNIVWTTEDTDNFYVGRIKVKYFENIGGTSTQKWLHLPVRLVDNNGELIPIYPVASKSRAVSYSMNAINHAFQSLSENIAKENITISTYGIVEVLSLDENLSRYYASILEDNKYTVRVNESDYSNVDGGFGVFGSLNRETKRITIQSDYITSFGYKVLFEN
ncbi:MAG: DUF4249 family protein [Ignavibacteriales bacterium]|jgi:hypothetical protein|nr:MAG: DUF4249 family protein [Ignavibacteriales bacterium]